MPLECGDSKPLPEAEKSRLIQVGMQTVGVEQLKISNTKFEGKLFESVASTQTYKESDTTNPLLKSKAASRKSFEFIYKFKQHMS